MSRPRRPARDKIAASVDRLVAALRPDREAGRAIVFTNGCFDLIHSGHLRVLESAAQHGDLLVVGLNGDASVRRLKGPGRPILSFEERSLLIAGLETVDWVVAFDEDTPAALIERLRPDVLVKGGDWAPDRIVGRGTVESAGGRVVTVPLVEGRSTTEILARIAAAASRVGREP